MSAKTFSVRLGGQERPLRFTVQDAIALGQRFGDDFKVLFFRDIFVRGKGPSQSGRIEVQTAFLAACIRRAAPKVTEDFVLEWIDKHFDEGGKLTELTGPAIRCAFWSGLVLNERLDYDAWLAATADEIAGKDQAPEDSTPATDQPQPGSVVPAASGV